MGYLGRLAFIVGAAALFVGCGGSQPQIGAPGAMPQSRAIPPHMRRGGSWILPREATGSSGDLLYVSDGGVDYFGAYVVVYSYPQGKHVATLTDFNHLTGECSDANGNVFVIAPGEKYSGQGPTTIYEYAHGGSTPIASLTESGYGLGCAVDPTTGNLAVANPFDAANPYHQGYGDVAIFAGASGNPTMYYSSTFEGFANCGYDNQGNLYLSAANSGEFSLATISAGSSGSIKPINLKTNLYGGVYFNPTVQWDGKHMTVSSTLGHGNPKYTGPVKVYRLSISGTTAKVIGTTTLDAPEYRQRGDTWILGNTIIGIDYEHGRPYISFWRYPKGGNPTREIKHRQYPPGSLFWGVTVSVAPSR